MFLECLVDPKLKGHEQVKHVTVVDEIYMVKRVTTTIFFARSCFNFARQKKGPDGTDPTDPRIIFPGIAAIPSPDAIPGDSKNPCDLQPYLKLSYVQKAKI